MKRILRAFLVGAPLAAAGAWPAEAQPTTVYYQPTPFPLYKYDGSQMPQALETVHIWDGWLGSTYYTAFFRDNRLQFGGWGDQYRTYLKLDLTGLPKNVTKATLRFSAFNRGDSSTSTPFAFCRLGGTWNLSLQWSTQPSALTCAGYFAAPAPGSWWAIDFTNWYADWQAGHVANNGLMMYPQYTNNRFDQFHSSLYSSDALRPVLQLDFNRPAGMPNFKIPLPGGYSWLVTNEIGGYECKGLPPWPDTAHQGANYYAIDFSSRNQRSGGAPLSGSIPVLAAAAGTVLDVGGSQSDSRGFYVTLDHGNGYQTRYLHFNQSAARKNGTPLKKNDTVAQGGQIGIMGNSGTNTTGTHLHFNVWYNQYGGSDAANLSYVVMDGLLLKSFQTECSVASNGVPIDYIRYYASYNQPVGQ